MAQSILSFEIESFGHTDIGLVRLNNEDVWHEMPELRFYVLADGMGGHQAGEVAADKAVSTLCKIVKKAFTEEGKRLNFDRAYQIIFSAIEDVNRIVYKKGCTHEELRGMGTTICCMFFHEEGLIFGHVGDSRIYRLRDNKLAQLTEDHSLLTEMTNKGQLPPDGENESKYRHVVTRAIGTEPNVEPSLDVNEVSDGDIYMMCTDGISDMLSHDEIEKILRHSIDIPSASNHLINTALDKGGHDNATVLLLKVKAKQ